jgi:phospholipid/cholesterol/gamma-HCH transport system ATP-binding protein
MTLTDRPGTSAGRAADPGGREPLVRLDGVSYVVAGRTILDGIDVAIPCGKVTAIMGPSGTGKTTLLRLITGQLRPTRGTVRVAGVDLNTLSDAELYEFRKRMGMLFQNGALLTDLDVYENVAFPLREHTRLPEELVSRIVLMKLQSVGLRGAARLMPSELSGGMARRVALARAIVMDPELLIYDEPFAGLDPIAMGVVLRLIRETNDALGITSIVVSHDVHEVGLLADQTLLLSGGGIAASGPPGELQKHDSEAVRQFMNGLPDGPVPFHYPAPDYATQLLRDEVAG